MSRPGEMASPKRDVVAMRGALLYFSPSESEMGVWVRNDLA